MKTIPRFIRFVAWESLVAAGISATAAGASAGINASGKKKSQERAYKYSSKLQSQQAQYAQQQMESQFDFASKMYERERQDQLAYDEFLRDYNSPSAIRERAYAAGMSPEAVMGLNPAGSAVGATMGSPSTPTGPAGHLSEEGFYPLTTGLAEFVSAYQQAELNQSVIDRNQAGARKDDSESGLIDKRVESFEAEINKLKAQANEANSRSALNNAEAAFKPLLLSAEIDKIEKEALESVSRALLNARKELESAKLLEVFDSQMAVYASQVGLNYAQGQLTKAQTAGQLIENEYALKTLDVKVAKAFEDYNLTKKQADFVQRQISHINWQEIHSEKELEFAIEKFDKELHQRKVEFWTNTSLHVYDKFVDTMNNVIRQVGNFMIFAR